MLDVTKAAPSMMDLARDTPIFVDGRFAAGEGKKFGVINPSTEEAVVEITGASEAQVQEVIESARRASGPWGELSREARAAILREFIAALKNRAAEVKAVLVAEAGVTAGGKPSTSAVAGFQVDMPLRQASEIIDLYLSLPEVQENPIPLDHRVTPMGKFGQSLRRYVPVGVVAGVAAYNFPLVTAMWKVIPALVTGNSLILRPSPLTPISSLIFAQAAYDVGLPAGILSVLIEEGIEGAQLLTTHPHVDMIAFTGSTNVGKQVIAQSASTMKRLQLELGGKSAQIFLPDSVDQAVAQAAGVCLSHAGQGCVLGTRIFVPQESKAQVLEGMKAAFGGLVVGEATDSNVDMGPVISANQVKRCEHFVQLAVEAGAKVVAGGKRPENTKRGYFFEPTVLDTPDNDNPAAREEIFGPVVSVIGYRDLDHAVEMANDSDYGLSGYVWGKDNAQALQVAKRLKTGTVNVNGGLASTWASSGGHKLSGLARERGEEGIRLYQNITCLTLCS